MKRRLAAGAAVLAVASPAVARTHAQPAQPAQAPSPTPAPSAANNAPGPDGLTPNSFYLEADQVTQDNKTKIATAEGHVEIRYRGRTLRAQSVVYDMDTQVVTAKGDVVVVNPDGTAEFAREMTLDKDLSAGVALGFSARLKNRVKLAADSLIRRNQDVTELNRAIYTPCDICADGKSKTPTWSIQASKVVEDRAHHVIYYHHAIIRVLGVPVLYLPVMWNADPDTPARSGFLTPMVMISNKRGFTYEQPYLVNLSPSQDLTIAPQFSSQINPFLFLDYHARFYSGEINARVGATDEYEFDNNGNRVPGSAVTPRSFVLADGAFNLNNDWSWGFAAERASDDTLFDRYDIHGVYDQRGLFQTDSRRLLSQAYAVRQDQSSYLSVSVLDFQGLRVNDVNAAMPLVAPLVEGRFEPDSPVLGGRLLVAGQAAVVSREADLLDPTQLGEDSRTASGQADWRRAFTLSNGMRLEPFLDGRLDVYDITSESQAATAGSPAPPRTTTTTVRALPSAGVDLSYPFIRASGNTTIVLEPLVEGVVAPKFRANPDIPDEDSRDFNFDESSMFNPNINPGIDVYNEGPRLDTGGRATIDWGGGHEAYAFFGRSFRSTPDLNLPPGSGFQAPTSDWIFAASASPIHGVSIYDRTEVNSSTGQLQHEEAGANLMTSFLQGYVRYIHDISDPTFLRHNIDLAGDLYVTRHWGIAAYGTRDLDQGQWSRRDIGVFYQNDCARIELVYHYEAGFAELGPSSTTVLLRLTLATLGQQGYRDAADR